MNTHLPTDGTVPSRKMSETFLDFAAPILDQLPEDIHAAAI